MNPRYAKSYARGSLLGGALAVGLSAVSMPVMAANPTFAIVGPTEWDLPIVPSANVFMQTGVVQTNGSEYGPGGRETGVRGSHTFVGISRFAHLFSFESLPKVGFFWEVLIPEIRAGADGLSGIGDPLFDAAVYFKPTDSSMLGLQNIVSAPVGQSSVTNNFWEYYPNIIGDYRWGHWGLDGTLGAGFPSIRRVSGSPDEHIGNMYYAEASLRYQLNSRVTPFVTYNYQMNEPGRVVGGATVPGSHESVLGGGVKFNFTPDRWLALWYDSGIEGQNTVKTAAVYLRFVNIF